MFDTISLNIEEILSHPAGVAALLIVLVIILAGILRQRSNITTGTLVNTGLMLALAIVLHQLRLYQMPQGGSITLGGMLPLLFVTWRYGINVGCLAGFIFGCINILLEPFIVHPIQVLFDYPLPYMALALCGLIKGHRYTSALLAFLTRYICHIISGVVFFASYAPEGTSPLVYSMTANAMFLFPDIVICFVLMKLLPIDRLLAAMDRKR